MPKLKTIKLSGGHAPTHLRLHSSAEEYNKAMRFRVEQITNSIEFDVGELLERKLVQELCVDKNWRVIIVMVAK